MKVGDCTCKANPFVAEMSLDMNKCAPGRDKEDVDDDDDHDCDANNDNDLTMMIVTRSDI
jgi:hypothetical protein